MKKKKSYTASPLCWLIAHNRYRKCEEQSTCSDDVIIGVRLNDVLGSSQQCFSVPPTLFCIKSLSVNNSVEFLFIIITGIYSVFFFLCLFVFFFFVELY